MVKFEEDVKGAEKGQAKAPEPRPPATRIIHAKRIFETLAILSALSVLVIVKLCEPGLWVTLLFSLLGLPVGVAFSFLYYQRKRTKVNVQRMFNVTPGVKGLKNLVSCLPTWISLSDTEKAEWMNAILLEMWPFYDAAVCELVKEIVEPIMDSIKPPLVVKRIGFKKLQFGDAPIRIEGVRMDRGRKDVVALEIDFRWAGDANIVLAIEPAVGGDATRMCPKISNVRCVGTIGVTFTPLVDEIPGFGAVLVTLMKSPKLSYRVSLGRALGGGISGGAIKSFVDGLLPTILEGFLVWPQRVVVPLFDETVTGPLDKLMLRHKGILKVTVLEAKDIPRMDQWGKSDPFVEIFTDPKRKATTSTKKNTLHPVWEETFYLMVQEPDTQHLRWEMFDVDIINAKQMLKSVNVLKNLKESIQNKSTMAKGEISMREVSRAEHGVPIEKWYWQGSDDWSADDGPGRDCGEIKLRMTYLPLQRINPMVGEFGALFVRAKKGHDFPQMIPGQPNSCSPYYTAKVSDKKETSLARFNTTEPDWTGTSVELYGVANEDVCRIKFYHKQSLSDEMIGRVSVEIAEVRGAQHHGHHGVLHKEYELEDADSGRVEIECQFVPYF